MWPFWMSMTILRSLSSSSIRSCSKKNRSRTRQYSEQRILMMGLTGRYRTRCCLEMEKQQVGVWSKTALLKRPLSFPRCPRLPVQNTTSAFFLLCSYFFQSSNGSSPVHHSNVAIYSFICRIQEKKFINALTHKMWIVVCYSINKNPNFVSVSLKATVIWNFL